MQMNSRIVFVFILSLLVVITLSTISFSDTQYSNNYTTAPQTSCQNYGQFNPNTGVCDICTYTGTPPTGQKLINADTGCYLGNVCPNSPPLKENEIIDQVSCGISCKTGYSYDLLHNCAVNQQTSCLPNFIMFGLVGFVLIQRKSRINDGDLI